jgi:hypothetical protein
LKNFFIVSTYIAVLAAGLIYYYYWLEDRAEEKYQASIRPPATVMTSAPRSATMPTAAARAAQRRGDRASEEAKRVEAENAERDQQIALLKTEMDRPGQWKTFVPRVQLSLRSLPDGRLWFHYGYKTPSAGHDLEFLAQVEKLNLDAKYPVLGGGELLLIDSAKRIWVRTVNYRSVLRCFENGRWKAWRATGEEINNADVQREPPGPGEWEPACMEDAAGNLFFIGGSDDDCGIFTRHPDGTWDFAHLAKGTGERDKLLRRKRFVQLPGGRACLYDETPPTGERPHVPYFDGKQWTVLVIEGCEDRSHTITKITPLPDGSFLEICSQHHAWIYWPPGLPQSPLEHIDDLLARMDDPDPKQRDQAEEAVIALGISARQKLTEARTAGVSPQVDRRLPGVLAAISQGSRGTHAEAAPSLGHYTFQRCGVAAAYNTPAVALWGTGVTDVSTGEKISRALFTMSADGQWKVHRIAEQGWAAPNQPYWPFDSGHYDPAGKLWMNIGAYLDPQMNFVQAAPDGLEVNRPAMIDSAGRIMFDRQVIYDPTVPAAATTSQLQVDLHGPYQARNAHTTFALDRRDGLAEVLLLDRQEPQPLPGLPQPWRWTELSPLKDGVLALNNMDSTFAAHFWDGQRWVSATSLLALIEDNLEAFMRVAGPEFNNVGTRVDDARVASDGKVAWVYTRRATGGATRETFRCFDGERWHDGWEESGLLPGNTGFCGGIENGAALLAFDRSTGELFRVALKADKVAAIPLMTIDSAGRDDVAAEIVRGKGREWLRLQRKKTYLLEAGKITPQEDDFLPLFEDSSQRLWAMDKGELVCRIGEATTKPLTSTFPLGRAMMTADGQVLALDVHGVQRLVIDGEGAGASIRAAARFDWDEPRSQFDHFKLDAANRFWVEGRVSGRTTRITLPETFWAGG